MSEALLGIIIGGAIGIIPTLATCIIEFKKECLRQRHEFRMKRIELYETDRMRALKEYCNALGACIDIDPAHCDAGSLAKLKSDYNKAFNGATLFVSRVTHEAMLNVCEPWELLIDDPDVVHLNRCLHAEVGSAFDELQ